MHALILSKNANQYQKMASEASLNTKGWLIEKANAHLRQDTALLSEIEWILAEPSLVLPLLPYLTRLKWLQSTWAGIESLLAPDLKRDYTLTNIRGVFAPLMTEYVLTHILMNERQVQAHMQASERREWFNHECGVIRGKTVLIMGMGSIGAGMAQALHTLGMRVTGIARHPNQVHGVQEVGTFSDLPRLLSQADYVINVLPNTPETQDFIDEHFLNHMQPHAMLINVGRGQAVVDQDLIHALQQGKIAGAVLDVCRVEPLPQDHTFWSTPNLTITSHTAAPSFPADIFEIFRENLQRYEQGMPLLNTVDFQRGY